MLRDWILLSSSNNINMKIKERCIEGCKHELQEIKIDSTKWQRLFVPNPFYCKNCNKYFDGFGRIILLEKFKK